MCKRNEAKKIVEDNTIKCEFTVVRPYVLCALVVKINDKPYRVVKHAIQGKHDTWNQDVGMEIAYGRAVTEIAKHAQLIS